MSGVGDFFKRTVDNAKSLFNYTFTNDLTTTDHRTKRSIFTGTKDKNPYRNYYNPKAGYIFGRPASFSPRTDPNQRVFQHTMLRNTKVLTIIPGIPFADKTMIDKAAKILEDNRANLSNATNGSANGINQIAKVQNQLIKAGCDLRFLTFKKAVGEFLMAYQMMLNRVSVGIFGTSALSMIQTLGMNEDSDTGGFKVWIEKGTSITESMDNSFTQSMLEQATKQMSRFGKELRFANIEASAFDSQDMVDGEGDKADMQRQEAEANKSLTSGNIVEQSTGITSKILSALSGSTIQFPQVYDESKFTRSYDISFRFMSPYGDDQSVFWSVLAPTLFMITLSGARQDGISGQSSPFILQMDCPGFFSCPMGVVTSLSFKKGGDDAFFNRRGLPLVIEGTMNVMDLYSSLSIPMRPDQFAVNFGTSSFLDNLAGLSIYYTYDRAVVDRGLDYINNAFIYVTQPIKNRMVQIGDVTRFLGLAIKD